MTDLIRSACLTHFPAVARSVGIEPTAMLRRARLPLACLNNPDMRIAVSVVRRLLEASAAAAGVDEFGLRMAERGGLSNLGPVALVVREQATIGTAIEALARYIHIHHEAMRLRLEQQQGVFTIALILRGGPPRPQLSQRKWLWEAFTVSSFPCSAAAGGLSKFILCILRHAIENITGISSAATSSSTPIPTPFYAWRTIWTALSRRRIP